MFCWSLQRFNQHIYFDQKFEFVLPEWSPRHLWRYPSRIGCTTTPKPTQCWRTTVCFYLQEKSIGHGKVWNPPIGNGCSPVNAIRFWARTERKCNDRESVTAPMPFVLTEPQELFFPILKNREMEFYEKQSNYIATERWFSTPIVIIMWKVAEFDITENKYEFSNWNTFLW